MGETFFRGSAVTTKFEPDMQHPFQLKSDAGQSRACEMDPFLSMRVVGWQESIGLPEFGLDAVVAKLDSGAAHSALHVQRLELFRRSRADWVRFELGDELEFFDAVQVCEARVSNIHRVQSSSGHVSVRPVIETMMLLAGFQWPVHLSLTSRKGMQFPMLIGRSALAGRCLVDSGRTHLAAKGSL